MPRTPRRHPRIAVDPRVMSGKPCLRGTRVPVALVLGMDAAQDLDQRALAGPVLAHERQDLARAQLEIHAPEHPHARERLPDAPRHEPRGRPAALEHGPSLPATWINEGAARRNRVGRAHQSKTSTAIAYSSAPYSASPATCRPSRSTITRSATRATSSIRCVM